MASKQTASTVAKARAVLLDAAADIAKKNPQRGVEAVIALLNAANAAAESMEVQNIMDGATERGFRCEFWPSNGGMSIRVQYIPKKEA